MQTTRRDFIAGLFTAVATAGLIGSIPGSLAPHGIRKILVDNSINDSLEALDKRFIETVNAMFGRGETRQKE